MGKEVMWKYYLKRWVMEQILYNHIGINMPNKITQYNKQTEMRYTVK